MTDESGREHVKVVDRRWFTPDGELKEPIALEGELVQEAAPAPVGPEEPPAESEQVEVRADTEPESVPPAEDDAPRANLPSRVLLDLVDFLAQYAMAFLTGQAAGIPRDPKTARLFVDLLTTVQERTRGQASLQEAKVLQDVLYQLRLQYMATSR